MNLSSAGESSNTAVRSNGYIWLISTVAALGGLLFGYDWVVIGGARAFFEAHFHIVSPVMSGWVNSCALIGCLLGAMISGALSEKFGRKPILTVAAVTFIVTSLGNGLAPDLNLFIIWRILGGVAIGLASALSPLYISETAPANLRGRLVSINQLTIVVGILMAQIINWYIVRNLPGHASPAYIAHSWFGTTSWRWMFCLTAIPAACFFFGMLAIPESPRWLIKKGSTSKAKEVLSRIGGADYAQAEIDDVTSSLARDTSSKVTLTQLISPRLRRVLILGIVLAVFQQWCGINVIFNYANSIFKSAGYDIADTLKNIVMTGSMNLVFTLVAMRFVDISRRKLMLIGSLGLGIIYTSLGLGFFVHLQGLPMLVLVLMAIGCYASTLAPVTWVVISEIFPNSIRGAAVAVSVTALWAASFVLTLTFPALNTYLGPAGTFWLYAVICISGFLFILKSLPETRGKTLEQLEAELMPAARMEDYAP